MNSVSEEDKLLFEQAVSGSRPLRPSKQASLSIPKPKPKRHRPAIMPELDMQLDTHCEPVHAFENLAFYRKGLRLQEINKLRKGEAPIQWQLDLHGAQEQQAQQELKQFIEQAYAQHKRFLLVIHGKGYNSESDYPILKNLVNRVLRGYKQVLAFCSAQPKDGGTGSVYVMLKAQRGVIQDD